MIKMGKSGKTFFLRFVDVKKFMNLVPEVVVGINIYSPTNSPYNTRSQEYIEGQKLLWGEGGVEGRLFV